MCVDLFFVISASYFYATHRAIDAGGIPAASRRAHRAAVFVVTFAVIILAIERSRPRSATEGTVSYSRPAHHPKICDGVHPFTTAEMPRRLYGLVLNTRCILSHRSAADGASARCLAEHRD